ncbi:MAG: hypothetical protein SV062_13725 [Thermodesulfobacteriota bacterium]|nr:hypothetical protein [Thermodesulfobacteriota bacterium]
MNKFIHLGKILLVFAVVFALHSVLWAGNGSRYIFKWKFGHNKTLEYEFSQDIEISKQNSGKDTTFTYNRYGIIRITGIDEESADMKLTLMNPEHDPSSGSEVMNYKISSDGKIIPLDKDIPFSSMATLFEILMSLPSSPLGIGEKYVQKISVPPKMNKFSLEGSVNINYTGNKKVLDRNCGILKLAINLKGASSEASSLKGESISVGNGTAYFDLKGGCFVSIESEMESKADSLFNIGVDLHKINIKQKQKTILRLKQK